MKAAIPRAHSAVLPDLSASVPCEMADPVSYAPDDRTVESFRPCDGAAEWRLVIRWHHGPGKPDEHLLCGRHLNVWQVFRAVEDPPWDITLLAPL